MSSDTLISFRNVSKTYGRQSNPVLKDVNLDIPRGQVISIIGPSGCGKSTLLNLLAGLTDVTGGEIVVSEPSLRSAYVFQNPRLLPWRSVLANVEYGLEQIGIPKKERRARAEAALHMVHLGEYMDRYPNQLSGGMQQRTALARGLAIEPTLLLLDEPLGALDALTRGYLQEEILRIIQRLKATSLLVTHDIDEAILLGDRILVMSSRPARVRQIFDVPFGEQRDQDSLVGDPTFAELRHEIRELLRPEMMASDPTLAAEAEAEVV